jgi:hypothetical protein
MSVLEQNASQNKNAAPKRRVSIFSRRHSGAMRSIEPQMRNCASGNLKVPGSLRAPERQQ